MMNLLFGIPAFIIGLWIFWALFGLIGTIFWLWMLIDCLQKKHKDKLAWILVIILVPLLGSILYFFIVKNKKKSRGE